MKNLKKCIALAAAMSTCFSAGIGTYPASSVSALTLAAVTMDVSVEKNSIAMGEFLPINISWRYGSEQPVSYTTNDTHVVSVTDEGLITGVGEGNARITVSTLDGSEKKMLDITVTEPASCTFEIQNRSIVFKDYASNAMLYYIVSSNQDYDMDCGRKEATFTPAEDGTYVLTVSALQEQIVSSEDGHFHYFYPVLSNYTVHVSGDDIKVIKQGSYSYYSGNDIRTTLENMAGNDSMVCFDVMAEGSENLLNSRYVPYVHGQMEFYKGEGYMKSFPTTIYSEYSTDSYFILYAECGCDEQTWAPRFTVSDENTAEIVSIFEASGYVDGYLRTGTDDEYTVCIAKALQDGKVTITADGKRGYDLVVKEGIFKRRSVIRSDVRGDANGDGEISTADAVTVQKWLLGAEIPDGWENMDLYPNGRIDALDLALLKRELLKREQVDTRPRITQAEVIALFQKETAPTWSDFAPYRSQDVGSGLFILRHEIEMEDGSTLFLHVCGPSVDKDPEWIDIEDEHGVHIDTASDEFKIFLANGLRYDIVAPQV